MCFRRLSGPGVFAWRFLQEQQESLLLYRKWGCRHMLLTLIFFLHNVLDPAVEHRILNWIANNRVMLVWLGMPCTTFSRARRDDGVGPTPLRDSQHLWGLPHLKRHDRSKLSDGNRIFNFTMKVLHLCQQHDIPYILENPLTSMAWEMPPLQKFVSLHSSFL